MEEVKKDVYVNTRYLESSSLEIMYNPRIRLHETPSDPIGNNFSWLSPVGSVRQTIGKLEADYFTFADEGRKRPGKYFLSLITKLPRLAKIRNILEGMFTSMLYFQSGWQILKVGKLLSSLATELLLIPI
jgi:hypothetical protein